MTLPTPKPALADLSLPVRLVLTVFLITVGLGYLSALVQLRVQHASNGQAMPSAEDVRNTFFGIEGKSQLERLLTAPISLPFNGSGSMKGAFMDPAIATGLDADVKKVLKTYREMPRLEAMQLVSKRRDGERLALLEWLKKGADKDTYEDDSHSPSEDLAKELNLGKNTDEGDNERKLAAEPAITEKFLDQTPEGKQVIKIRSIFNSRCVRCHREGSGSAAAETPLDSYEGLMVYNQPEKSGGMSLPKLAQSTHVHLLGFAVLWCLTGLIVACTGFPLWMRALVGPSVLVAQVADIACWWLAGASPQFANAILVTGGLVGVGLVIQMLMGFWDLFRGTARVILFLVLIFIGLAVARFYVRVVEPRLSNGHGVSSPSVVEKTSSG